MLQDPRPHQPARSDQVIRRLNVILRRIRFTAQAAVHEDHPPADSQVISLMTSPGLTTLDAEFPFYGWKS